MLAIWNYCLRRQAITSSCTAGASAAVTSPLKQQNHLSSSQQQRSFAANTVYKFSVTPTHIDTVKATLPLVANAGTDFTKHFYRRLFVAHPELQNVFNQTNQTLGGQPKKLLKTVAVAAQAAIETGELPGELIEGICQKHCSLNLLPEAYDLVGTHLLGTIEDLFTTDKAVIDAWADLYGDIKSVFVTRESEIYQETAAIPNSWVGKRMFILADKIKLSSGIARFKFEPVDGLPVPHFTPGKFTTVWAAVNEEGPYGHYKEQPRHYTLNLPMNDDDDGKNMFISVKKDGLVSSILHTAAIGSQFELSAPFGCFVMTGSEKLWLANADAPTVFLSAGIGITPVLAMLESIYVTRPATWLHASHNGAVHPYRERLREIAAVRAGVLQRRVWYEDPLPADGIPGKDDKSFNLAKFHYKGRMNLPDAKDVLHLDDTNTQYYMCGPKGFMDEQKTKLVELGVSEDKIHWEGFA